MSASGAGLGALAAPVLGALPAAVLGALPAAGLVALPEAVAQVEEVVRTGGERLLVLRLAGGLSIDVRPDRGLDLGAVWWRGVPLAWRSPHRADPGPGHGWEERFLGGLMVTCGPENIGPPTATAGQHGSHHLTPATEVRWWREVTPTGVEVHVRGVVGHSTLYGTRVVVEREIVAATDRARVEVRDVVRNDGAGPVGVPLLYHVNLGAPLLAPGGRLHLAPGSAAGSAPGSARGSASGAGVRTRVRDPLPDGRDPLVMPAPLPGAEAVVAEHQGLAVGPDGLARAVLTAPSAAGGPSAPQVVLEWPAGTLPRLCTWAWPAHGTWVLGVEPTNAPLFGAERDLPHAGAPVLGPGERWSTGVAVEVVDPLDRAPLAAAPGDPGR
ncbi:MAG TPA: DUF4432 family protein [Cellulomonas sp.]